jgi:glycosyltransferase involved in cell wall biosynthesis
MDIQVHTCKAIPAQESVKTVDWLPFLRAKHDCRGYLGNRLFWQEGMCIDKELGPGDVLVVNGNLRWLSNYPLLLEARSKSIGTIWWAHGGSASSMRLADVVRRQFMRWADAVLLYTDVEVEDYVAHGFPAQKLFATNNTIDTRSIERAKSYYDKGSLDAFRRSKDLEDPFFLYCGRLKPASRLDLAMEAIAQLNRGGHDCELVIIGEGDARCELESLVGHLGIDERVRWLDAMYDQEDLAPWFLSATAMVYPGPIGLSLIHSMAYGLPVVTHDNREHHKPEIAALEDGKNGLMFREGGVNDLVEKLEQLLIDNDLQSKLSEYALQSVAESYTMDKMIKRFVSAIEYASLHALKRVQLD